LAAYWIGEQGLPLVIAFAFIAGALGFIGAGGVESGPLPNMAEAMPQGRDAHHPQAKAKPKSKSKPVRQRNKRKRGR
jgi:hypothetical protein